MSLEYNHENSRAWTGLGLLYLKIGETQKSHYALTRAQVNSSDWTIV